MRAVSFIELRVGVIYSLATKQAAEPASFTFPVIKTIMKNVRYAVAGLLSAVLMPFSLESFAQGATLDDCQAIEDRLARYACYDSLEGASGVVPRPVRAARSGDTDRAGQEAEDEPSLFGRIFGRDSDEEEQQAEELAAISKSAEPTPDSFGKPQANTTRIVKDEDGKSELIGTVAALEQVGPSLWLVTLDGGQQWRQMVSKRYNLQVGQEVRIYSTRWGSSFRMSSRELGGYIQVQRVD